MKPDILFMDEPFGALDSITRAEMQEWLAAALDAQPHTLVLVTHDVEEALALAGRVLVMTPRPGRVAAEIKVSRPQGSTRREWVTSTEFARLKAEALEALG